MPRLFLFSLLLFYATSVLSVDFQRKINWHQEPQNAVSADSSAFGFEGSIFPDQSGIPYWFESFDLNLANPEILIKEAVFEPVQNARINLNDSVGSDLKFTTEIGVSSGHSILRLTIFPFVRRNNRIEKLVEFTVSISGSNALKKSAAIAYQWKSTSVLGSGKWVKIKTKNKGIYKITFDQLREWGFTTPDQVVLYGNGGYMLPNLNRDTRSDDLNSYPVWKGKDNAGKDCLFFYSSGTIRLKENPETRDYSHQQNYYATETYFYLSDQGIIKTIDKVSELTATAGRTINSFVNYTFHEKEELNLISSGSQWFGERFSQSSSQSINMALDNPDLSKPARFVFSTAGRSSASSSMNVAVNGKSVNNIVYGSTNVSNYEGDFASLKMTELAEILPSKNIQVKLTYDASNGTSEAWLDYFGINYESFLNVNADVYSFRGRGVDGQIPVSEFILKGASVSTKIIDVTDLNNCSEIPAVYADGQMKFKSNSDITREYVAFNPAGTIPSPEWVGAVANQNLHAADLSEMIIVVNPALSKAADELAVFHRDNDQMSVQVVTPEEVYNEFSGGLPDPAGIRNYFRMCYDWGKQNGKNTLKYILLVGDGSYDNRNILGTRHNLIPTFQSDNSISGTESFVSDDFFVFLDENEGGYLGTVDLGIGRIPAFTLDQAEVVVYKILNYRQKESMGNWRNVVTFIGDDEDNNLHMGQAEDLADFVNKTYPAFYADKIYLDAYKQISASGGEKYPDVTAAINSRVKQGTLLMNYTGHANTIALAAEKVLDIANINSWSNMNRLPVFVTATCEFSRFDDDEISAGEQILFNPAGGGVGLFSTTRLVYSGANFIMNSKFFENIFRKDDLGNNFRLGDVMRMAKAAANTGANQLSFSLLADPAMRLANPDYQIKTTSIDGKSTVSEVDTIEALSVVTVKGFVADSKGAKLTSFNGEIIPTVYDKAMQVKTLGNAGESPMNYTMQNNIIYKGLSSVTNGEFEFTFFVPKDISVKLGKGKISYYASSELLDAQGYFDGFFVGGASNTTISDSKGPDLELFLNSESFKDGGQVSASSVLIANIRDDTGINTSGTGIGHDITAVLDGDYSNIMILNDYFQSDKDLYTSGKIIFPLTKLTEGEHILTLKVWDVLNNSSEKEIRFFVKDDLRIETVTCYPNPMQGQTQFVFTHNHPDEKFDVTLEVFETTGSRVDIFQAIVGSSGTESLPMEWIPADRKVKMKPGVYIYRLTVTKDEKVNAGSGRLVYVYR